VPRYLVSPLVPAGRPVIVGIVNITEDSFSDGGRYLTCEDTLAHARRLRSAGADIIELGPAASHPDAVRVTADDQRRRLASVIDQLTADGIPVSLTRSFPTCTAFAIAHGAAYLNDIQGCPEPGRYEELAAATCALIIMHSVQRCGPATRVRTDPAATWEGVDRFFAEGLAGLKSAGIGRNG